MRKLPLFLVPAVLLVLLFVPFQDTVSGDDPDHDPTYLVTTERMQIGNNPDALIWTWGRFQGDVPQSIGVSFTDLALIDMFTAPPDGVFPYSLPHLTAPELEPARVYNLDLPVNVHKKHDMASPGKMGKNYNIRFPEKVRSTTPFDHMGWFANAQGHAPRGVFDMPHVDVHFFIITVEDRKAISGQLDDPKLLAYPPAGFLPADFCLPLAVFPPQCKTLTTLTASDIPGSNDSEQGLHWVDQLAPELRGEPFRQIFIFGSYDGKVNFWEPMITKQFFEDVRSFLTDLQSTGHTIAVTFDIKQPEQFLETSYYPTQYSIRYDADAGEFSVSLDNFVLRKATQVAMQ
jgi:hypothetical protein